MKTILACIDFSETSEPVLDVAIRLAKALDDKMYLLHVAPPEPDFVGAVEVPVDMRQRRADELRREHRDLQARAERLKTLGITCDALLVEGVAHEKIIEQADRLEADVIILGSHGHSRLYDLLVGSTTESVLHHATRPVMIVPSVKNK